MKRGNWKTFPAFPVGARVPADSEIEVASSRLREEMRDRKYKGEQRGKQSEKNRQDEVNSSAAARLWHVWRIARG